VSLRIGCDLDGVLADMESELVRHAKMLFRGLGPRRSKHPPTVPDAAAGVEPPQKHVSSIAKMDISDRQLGRLWRHVESIDGFWETLKEVEPGSVSRLAALASDCRWELIFLTKRPESAGDTAQLQTQRWLQAQGFAMPSVFVVQGSRGRIAAALDLDFVIDDRPENCLDVVFDSTSRALLVWREDEAWLPAAVKRPGIQVVASFADCLEILTRADEAARKQPGLIGWLKKQLRYGETDDEA
jgi:hypothetical protein